jgi:hypothetical protein
LLVLKFNDHEYEHGLVRVLVGKKLIKYMIMCDYILDNDVLYFLVSNKFKSVFYNWLSINELGKVILSIIPRIQVVVHED